MGDRTLDAEDLTAVCYARAPLLLNPVDSKVETLRRCEREGAVRDLVVRSWPDTVSLEPDAPNREVVERFEEFRRWADAQGVSVRPPFRVREATTVSDEESTRVLVTPLLCVALYHEEGLLAVYPHSDGETTYTAPEAIADLSTGVVPTPSDASPVPVGGGSPSLERTRANAALEGRQPATTPTSCPRCEGELVNVQGILSCTGCQWTGADLNDFDSPPAKLV